MIQALKMVAYGLWLLAGTGVACALYGLFVADMVLVVTAGCVFSFALLVGCIAWAVRDNALSKR
jgi:hypothetical protein